MNDRPVEPPSYEDLVTELGELRRAGITELRRLDLPALTRAAHASGITDATDDVQAPQIESMLRGAIDDLGSGRLGETARVLFGLEPGSRAETSGELRRSAAIAWGVSEERFRRQPQDTVISETAEAILRTAQRYTERLAHLALERRLPTTSRLAVSWLERFEAYYRIWTPVSGLGGDLIAYRSALLEADRPWDRPPGSDGPDDPGYSQEEEAAGYITFALWHYSRFLVALDSYVTRYGGLWLLSDPNAEASLATTTWTIRNRNPNNERDDSYVRQLHEQANGELDAFLRLVKFDQIGAGIHAEWQEWAGACRCTWFAAEEVATEHLPTNRHHRRIDASCSLHAVSTACNDYMALVDDGWRRIADWYWASSVPSLDD